MNDLISRKALLNAFKFEVENDANAQLMLDLITNSPAVEQGEAIGWYIKGYFVGSDNENTWTYSENKYDLEYATKRGLVIELRYTSPPQPQTVRDALEKAADICDEQAENARTSGGNHRADCCSKRIRALIEDGK